MVPPASALSVCTTSASASTLIEAECAADIELHVQSAALAGIEVDVFDLLALESGLAVATE